MINEAEIAVHSPFVFGNIGKKLSMLVWKRLSNFECVYQFAMSNIINLEKDALSGNGGQSKTKPLLGLNGSTKLYLYAALQRVGLWHQEGKHLGQRLTQRQKKN